MLRLAVVAPPMAHQAHSSSRSPALRVRAAPPKRHIPARASAGDAPTQPSMQLATAKVPGGVDVPAFNEYLWQWASTLTQNGANLPFALVLKADKLPSGCQVRPGPVSGAVSRCLRSSAALRRCLRDSAAGPHRSQPAAVNPSPSSRRACTLLTDPPLRPSLARLTASRDRSVC